jgi:hypothetical protein
MKGEPIQRKMLGEANFVNLSPNKPHRCDSDSLPALIATIECGIAKRLFHITNGEGLKPLWIEGTVSFREKLWSLHHFAEAHEWEVTSKDKLALVLFQPVGGTKLLSGGSSLGRER